MILNKLIYDIKESLNIYSDDTDISDRYIIYLYNIKRAKYLRQDLNQINKSIDLSIQQSYCAELEKVSVDSCGLDYTCDTIMRTKKPLPSLIELHTKPALISVKPTNRIGVGFNFITKKRMSFIDGSTFNKSLYSFLDDDGYLYVYSKNESYDLLECLTVTGVFNNPLELQNYSNCCGCKESKPCFDIDTTDYPIQPYYIDVIKNDIIQQLVGKLNIPEDTTNNSIDG